MGHNEFPIGLLRGSAFATTILAHLLGIRVVPVGYPRPASDFVPECYGNVLSKTIIPWSDLRPPSAGAPPPADVESEE